MTVNEMRWRGFIAPFSEVQPEEIVKPHNINGSWRRGLGKS